MTQTTDLKAIADALQRHDRFLVVTHENPDGDALGSLLALSLALRQLGKDAVMYLPGQTPLPQEYAFMPLDDLVREPPEDAAERVLLAVDCAKEDRIGDETVLSAAPLVLEAKFEDRPGLTFEETFRIVMRVVGAQNECLRLLAREVERLS